MQYFSIVLAWWIVSLRLILAKSSAKVDDHVLAHRSPSPTSLMHSSLRSRPSLLQRSYTGDPTSMATYSSAYQTSSFDSGGNFRSAALGPKYYQEQDSNSAGPSATSSSSAPKSTKSCSPKATPSESISDASSRRPASAPDASATKPASPLYAPTTQSPGVQLASAQPASLQSPSVSDASATKLASAPDASTANAASSSSPTCDKSHSKYEINRLLIECEAKVIQCSSPIKTFVDQLNQTNSQQIATQISSRLTGVLSHLRTYMISIQSCGTDPKPLSDDKGVAISDVSWSAFQMVLTLKTTFELISSQYPRYPVVQKLCSDVLLNISTALSNLVGACGEQINLFDTRFFPLVTPQLKEFTDISDNFISFVGSFVS